MAIAVLNVSTLTAVVAEEIARVAMSYATTSMTMLVWMVLCVLTAPAAFAQGKYIMVLQNNWGIYYIYL